MIRPLVHSAILLIALVTITPALSATKAFAEQFLASDNASVVEAPSGWVIKNGLNDSAELQLHNPKIGLYFVVLTDSKDDFVEMNIDKFAQRRLDAFVKTAGNAELGKREAIDVNGMHGFATEFNSVLDEVRIRHKHVCLEGKDKYFQILIWGTKSAYTSNQSAVGEILAAFHEKTAK